MNYTDEDYARLYNTAREHEKSRRLKWYEWLLIIAFAIGAGFSRDADVQENTTEAEHVALEKKLAVMGMPCTWIAQCSHEPCPVSARRCAPADLRAGQ